MRIIIPPDVRFEHKIERITETGCWIWMGNTCGSGYGRFYDSIRHVLAHRWSYERFRGPIADGMTLDHLCRVPSCVNPWHLEEVTSQVNSLRSPATLAGMNARKENCPEGHSYIEVVYSGRKRRRCGDLRSEAGTRKHAPPSPPR